MLRKLFHTGLHFDWKIVTITIVSTLVMMIDYYHHFIPGWKGWDRTLLYFVVPMVFILFVFRENPKDYGFQLGDWKAGLLITGGSLAIILPVLWLLVRGDKSMHDYYQPLLGPALPLYTFLEIFGWEFLFRGWLVFGYARKFGAEALWLQAVPFALGHLSKPEVETLSTIFGGFVFGWIAYRTKSFLYPFMIHWAIFTFVVLVAGGAFG
jgi:membrane protease YdiL (CAAX protease family)